MSKKSMVKNICQKISCQRESVVENIGCKKTSKRSIVRNYDAKKSVVKNLLSKNK